MNRRFFLVTMALASLSSCISTVTAPVDASGEGTPIYFISAQEADIIMRNAMVEVFPNLPIMSVAVPFPGYTASMNFVLDSHSVTLSMVPSKAMYDGDVRDGFSFRVSQYGSIPITGGIKANNLIKAIERMTSGVEKGRLDVEQSSL